MNQPQFNPNNYPNNYLEPMRWAVYHRLQELDIKCACSGGQPLKIEVDTPTQAVQVWSVKHQLNWQRHQAIAWLEQCWQLAYPQPQS